MGWIIPSAHPEVRSVNLALPVAESTPDGWAYSAAPTGAVLKSRPVPGDS